MLFLADIEYVFLFSMYVKNANLLIESIGNYSVIESPFDRFT